MVQSIDNRAVYSAVNIHITKPEINTGKTTANNDNGLYNAVKIDIDDPKIDTGVQKIYDYPQNNEVVTYNQLPISVSPANIGTNSTETIIPEEVEEIDIPSVNYTTLEAEKGNTEALANKTKTPSEEAIAEKKTPEIIPSEEIKPDIDISLVIDNLENPDFDVQAKQMVQITRTAIENPQKALPYIVKDVFGKLIEITNKDTKDLAAPTDEQINIRRKIIANYIVEEAAKQQNKEIERPYKLTDEEIDIANKITPMEQAERNKEYAIYTISVLSKIYTDEIQKETGNVVPFTDVPGMSDIIDALRYSSNPSVKVAAIDSLAHLARPEYKQELNTIFSIAQSDEDRMVSETASRVKQALNN